MLTAILLSLALAPQLPPASETPPPPEPGLKAADITPSAAGGAIGAGLAAFKKRRFGKAEIEFRKAVEADPASAAANFYLGYTYYKIGERKGRANADKQRAKELFAKAFELEPGFRPVWGEKK